MAHVTTIGTSRRKVSLSFFLVRDDNFISQPRSLNIFFRYFMVDPFIEQTGPSLGSLRVMMMEQDQQGFQTLTPLWELRNHQGPSWQYGQTKIKTEKTFMVEESMKK